LSQHIVCQPPATLGTTAKAHLLLRTWCSNCRHSVDVDPGTQAARYSADLPVPEWARRLVCSQCGSRAVEFVIAPGTPVASGLISPDPSATIDATSGPCSLRPRSSPADKLNLIRGVAVY
jgi:hypothetical protein